MLDQLQKLKTVIMAFSHLMIKNIGDLDSEEKTYINMSMTCIKYRYGGVQL